LEIVAQHVRLVIGMKEERVLHSWTVNYRQSPGATIEADSIHGGARQHFQSEE
jgi:hypothetical protein